MFLELASGRDSFPGGSRTVSLSTLVYNPAKGVFQNPRNVDGPSPVCRNITVTQGIPAGMDPRSSEGTWYYYRGEAKSGSLWLMEYRRRSDGVFQFETELLLLRAHNDYPLLHIKLNLPSIAEANVKNLSLTWNALRVTTHEELALDERNAFKKFTGVATDEYVDVSQMDEELPSFEFSILEKAAPVKQRVVRKQGKISSISRIKRIKT